MLNAVTTDIDTVEEAARKFYTERDGKFYLQVTPAEGLALEDVASLKGALSAERRKHDDARRQASEATQMLEAYGDLDPVAARAALAAGASGDVEAQLAARVEALRAGIAQSAGAEVSAARSELEATRGTLAAREAQLERMTKAAAISAELDRLGPLDDARDVLVMLASKAVVMRDEGGEMRPVVVDGAGAPAVDAQGRPVSVRAYMERLRDDRASLFKPTKNIAGLGTTPSDRGPSRAGSSQPNPFSKATWNLTQQVLLQQRNPALAARMRAEAA